MNTELENIEKMSPAKLFKPKFMPTLLKAIEVEATAEVPDVNTDEGRKAITSTAYKVARSKTTIDELGKDFVADQKLAIKAVDEIRKLARDFLDNLKVKVREPLTEWEEAEEARVQKIAAKLEVIKDLGVHFHEGSILPSTFLEESLAKLQAMKITKVFGEWQDEAISQKNAAIVNLMEWIPKAKEGERLAIEEEARQKQAVEDQRIENEQRIARDAVAAAESDAQEELATIKRNEEREAEDKAARERNTQHKGKIHRGIAADIMTMLPGQITEENAKKLVKALVKGQIRNTTITY